MKTYTISAGLESASEYELVMPSWEEIAVQKKSHIYLRPNGYLHSARGAIEIRITCVEAPPYNLIGEDSYEVELVQNAPGFDHKIEQTQAVRNYCKALMDAAHLCKVIENNQVTLRLMKAQAIEDAVKKNAGRAA